MIEYRKDELRGVKFSAKKIGVMLLESITQGLYKDPRNAIREYIQNEFDAGATTVRVETSADIIAITGNSPGMTRRELEMVTDVGISYKDSDSDVGFRGIGIWSGVAICGEIAIFSKKKGSRKGLVLVIDAEGITQDMQDPRMPLTESLSNRVFMTTPVAPDPSFFGTRVELRRINSHLLPSLKRDSLRSYLRQIAPLPLDPDFSHTREIESFLVKNVPNYRTMEVSLDGEILYRPPEETGELETPVMGGIIPEAGDEDPMGFFWYCIGARMLPEEAARRPIYKLMSFTVGDEHRKTLSQLPLLDPTPLRWVTGEFHIVDSRLRPNSERNDLETSESYNVFVEQITKLLHRACKGARAKSYRQSAERKMENAKTFIDAEDPAREDIIDVIGEGVRLKSLLKRDIDGDKFPYGKKGEAVSAFKSLSSRIEELVTSLAGETEKEVTEKEEEAEEPKKKPRKKPRKTKAPTAEKLVKSLKGAYVFRPGDLTLLRMMYDALKKVFKPKEIRRFEKAFRKIVREGRSE